MRFSLNQDALKHDRYPVTDEILTLICCAMFSHSGETQYNRDKLLQGTAAPLSHLTCACYSWKNYTLIYSINADQYGFRLLRSRCGHALVRNGSPAG